MTKKYIPRGRVIGRGGRPPHRSPEQRERKHPHEQTDDLRAWLWTQAYGPAAMPRNWLMSTTAMWTYGRDSDPDGIYAQLASNAGRLYDSGGAITWSHDTTPTDDQRAAAIEAMLDMAVEGRGWTALSFFGDEPFRIAAARQATRRGLTVTDADLRAVVDDERRRLAQQAEATEPSTPAPDAALGIVQASPPTPAAIAVAAFSMQPSPIVATFLAAGREAHTSGADTDKWLSLCSARMSEAERAEITAYFADQPAASARWLAACDNVLTADALSAGQMRGGTRLLRSVLDVTPPDRRLIVSDILHERADAAETGNPTDLAALRRRSAAQALAQAWDRMCDEHERAERDAARVEESPHPPVAAADIRTLGDEVLSAKRAERDRTGDPLDTVRAERALTMALDRAPRETRRAFADALTGKADALTSALAVAAMVADDHAAGLSSLSEVPRSASRPPHTEKIEDDDKEHSAGIDAPRPV
ncbi:LPD7 domain-containing protein [Azospirillum griseum]|nr:LPD7 domain-containing protein [Azospirillum griseum]